MKFVRAAIAFAAIAFASLLVAGCGIVGLSTITSGKTDADRMVAEAVVAQLNAIDDFQWPDVLSVDGKTVTLRYWNIEGEWTDTWDIDVEVDAVLRERGGSEGWTLVYRNMPSGRVLNTVHLPVTGPDPSPDPE